MPTQLAWSGAISQSALVQFADLRIGPGLTQAQLEASIGNDGTLLPDRPSETGKPYYVWSCWETAPESLDTLVKRIVISTGGDAAALRAAFLCGPDNPRRKVGTPLALDAAYPLRHPLRNRD